MKKARLNPWYLKGGIGTGTLYLVGTLVLIGFAGVQLTKGVVPTNIPSNKGVIVTPVFSTGGPDKNNLQLYTFGFIQGLITPTVEPSQNPTIPPTQQPTQSPTIPPTLIPTIPPTLPPTSIPTILPTLPTLPTTGVSPTLPTLPTSTISPTLPPTDYCPLDSSGNRTCKCISGELDLVYCNEDPCAGDHNYIADRIQPNLRYPPFNIPAENTCSYTKASPLHAQKKLEPQCIHVCVGKPVIYLYPLIKTLVDVKLTIPGVVFISDPVYPKEGWKNVLAHPDGTLIYQNKKYHELYYETDIDSLNAPKDGIVIPTKNLKEKLTEITTQLGLIKHEQDEFLEYWLPKLQELDSPYILFSVLDHKEKERIDHVDITPAPDTFIAFIAYFKPLETIPSDLKPLELPQTPPERIGFTAVEWGGTIDSN